MPLVNLTQSQINQGLTTSGVFLAASQFTFSIANASSTWGHYSAGTEPFNGYSTLTAQQATLFRNAMTAWDSLIAPDFTEVTETASKHGEIRVAFSTYNQTGAGYAYLPTSQTPTSIAGDIWINATTKETAGYWTDASSSGYHVFLHEIGHAIGLKHPFESPVIPVEYDSTRYTVMSYTDAAPGYTIRFTSPSAGKIQASSVDAYVATPMVLDIAAAQSLYGAETTTNAGDTVYSDFSPDSMALRSIYDAGGIDTIDLSGHVRASTLDLRPGAYSSVDKFSKADQITYWKALFPSFSTFITNTLNAHNVYEWQDNLGIAFSTVIENAKAGEGNDSVTGNDAANQLHGNGGNDSLLGGAHDDTLLGGLGNDTLDGGANSDTASYAGIAAGVAVSLALAGAQNTVGAGTDTLIGIENVTGGHGNDMLTGNASANRLEGGLGADVLNGGGGIDTMVGGAGNDTYVVDVAGDVITEAAAGGTDTVQTAISYVLGAEIENLVLTGAAAANGTGNGLVNSLTGNAAANILNGMAGADTMAGGAGNDTYVVDNAGDVVSEAAAGGTDLVQASVAHSLAAEVENLTLTGAAAIGGTGNGLNNVITGNSAANTLNGGAGNDTLDGAGGTDTMVGGAGNDIYIVDAAGEVVTEAAAGGTDTVKTALGYTLGAEVENLTLTGSGAVNGTGNGLNNVITGNAAVNALAGGAGDDTLNGGAGADTMTGGAGSDTYVVDSASDIIVEAAGGGIDTVQTAISYTLAAEVENLALTGNAAVSGTGNALANIIGGNGAANTLNGGAGNDTLNGGAGIDTMFGGAGNDIFVVDVAGDIVTEAAGGGTDTVRTAIAYALGAELENLILTGAAAVGGTGNALANRLTGNAAANTLDGGDGGAGADTLVGGAGNDVFVVDNAADVVTEAAAGGLDQVQSAIAYTLGANLENLMLTGNAAINGTGNGLNNNIIGNAAANVLSGGDGNDILNGGAGNDTMVGGAGNDAYAVDSAGDVVTEAAAGGTDTVKSGVSYTLGAELENLILTGNAAINGTGNAAANSLTGNGAANLLNGGGGMDQLYGGLGNDGLTGGAGLDGFYFDTALSASNVDAIADFSAADDTIYLKRSVFAGIASNGALAETAFRAGNAAADADDRILYEQSTGKIFYDSDGAGGAAAILFAQVTAGTALTHTDFSAYIG